MPVLTCQCKLNSTVNVHKVRSMKYLSWIDRRSLPPFLVLAQSGDCEMQVRRVGGRVAGRADVAKNLAAADSLALFQVRSVRIKVCVVVAVTLARSN